MSDFFLLGPAGPAVATCWGQPQHAPKQGGSIGAYGLLVHMVLARFKTKTTTWAQGKVCTREEHREGAQAENVISNIASQRPPCQRQSPQVRPGPKGKNLTFFFIV